MDSDSILEQARSGQAPSEWNVWPLRRDYVLVSMLKWGLLAIVGFVLLIPVGIIVVPADFTGKPFFAQLVAMLILVLLGALAFGSLGIAAHDLWRLARARDYWLIITPETFVKAQPNKLISTPLEDVANVTLKGVRLPNDEGDTGTGPGAGAPSMQFLIGDRLINFAHRAGIPGVSRRRERGAASLAYLDKRTNKVIIVCTDDSFDQMAAIYQLLRDRAATREEQVWRASFQPPLR